MIDEDAGCYIAPSGHMLAEILVGNEIGRELTEAEENARRVLQMVHELHRRGYQLLRIVPGMSPSGMYWRCAITPASNIRRDHGALPIKDEPQARYSSADERHYFEWDDAVDATPRELADLFLQRLPSLAGMGRGRDHRYAGWFVEMLGHVDRGGFPIAYDDGYFARGNPCPGQRELPTTAGWESGLPMPPPPIRKRLVRGPQDSGDRND